ncbi:hypothetical protein [Mesorhizobium sp. M0244]|uniref:hypothetical protein n=1 Tax=Mesorhizobium sp. M0244 TaxID=2956926 RepID=UPI003338ED11
MYQNRAQHLLSPKAPVAQDSVEEAMCRLLVAIGSFWNLTDEPEAYRTRLPAFMTNRISLDPKYQDYYALAQRVIDALIAEKGEAAAYEYLFTNKPRAKPALPVTELEYVQYYVANEFIALRLALGGFSAFGALNYRGYFGGANVPGQPAPYRTGGGI